MRDKRWAKHHGAAIIAAMLVTATVATLATGMLAQINGWFARSESARNAAQAQSLANAAVRWATQYLAEEARLGPLDHLGELWAMGLAPTPIEGGTLGGALSDAQARFNLNNILKENGEISDADFAFAKQLFEGAGLTAAQFSTFVAQRQRGWPTRFDVPPALHAVATALPTRTPLNVNTASNRVLLTLFPNAKPDAWRARAVQPFESAAQFLTAITKTDAVAPTTQIQLAVATNFFEIDAAATFGGAQAGAQALIDRNKGVVWLIAR